MSQIDSVIAKAKSQLGVTEIGYSNSGPEVDQYLAAVGLGPGQPWCAAFAMWACDKSGVPASTWDGLDNRAYCPSIENWARARGVLHQTPKRGDFMLLQMRDAQGIYSGHIGIVSQVNPDGTIDTIEGNTSPQNSGGSEDNGGGVHQRNRLTSSSLYVRWADLAAQEPRKVKIFRKPDRAVVVVDGREYTCTSLSINGAPPEAGSSFSLIAEY